MTPTVTPDLDWPIAPRKTDGSDLSLADTWCWTIARKTYEIAATRHARPTIILPWEKLSRAAQDIWFWRARFVMLALAELEK